MSRRCAIIVGIMIVSAAHGRSQDRTAAGLQVKGDSLAGRNLAAVSFDRAFNTYTWLGTLGYEMLEGATILSLRELFRSTLVETDRRQITDEQSLILLGKYALSPAVSGVGKLTSLSVADNQAVGIINVVSNAAYGGVELKPVEHFTMTPMIGVRYEKQIDQPDGGPSYTLDFGTDQLVVEGYQTNLGGRFQYDKLSPRTNDMRQVGVSAEKIFYEKTRNFFSFTYNRNRRDFYSPADSLTAEAFGVRYNIETRAEDGILAVDTLDYGLASRVMMSFDGSIFARSIDRDTRYRTFAGNSRPVPNTRTDEIKIDGGVRLRYDAGRDLALEGRFFYQERDEGHRLQADDSIPEDQFTALSRQEEEKNNHSRRAILSSSLTWTIAEGHSLSLTGSASGIHYDTPSEENFDDHDELYYIAGLTTSHLLSRYLTLALTADVNLTHLVYLFGERSADNTWNRIFRLSPRVEYRPSAAVTSLNVFEVLANYTSYDFEYPGSPIRSYAYRQYRIMDSTTIGITKRTHISFFGHLRLYERGDFQWESFAERPLDYFEDRTLIGAIFYSLKGGLLFSVGIRYFSQSRYGYSGQERQFQSIFRSSGPLTTIDWRLSGRTDFLVTGWYEHQTQTGTVSRNFANLTMSLVVHL